MLDRNLSLLLDLIRDGKKQVTLTANPAGGFDVIISDRDESKPIEDAFRDCEIGNGPTLEAAIRDAIELFELPY